MGRRTLPDAVGYQCMQVQPLSGVIPLQGDDLHGRQRVGGTRRRRPTFHSGFRHVRLLALCPGERGDGKTDRPALQRALFPLLGTCRIQQR
ncbi:hypothetical protein [Phocaeicola abscessus]|uniref:hypothetical protein n=1 Tax=Phocaeicola abscessus TaxID=555313 RepID=UPI0028F04F03|nr:hypothetical protein [Phocaeicola abscessus]